MIVKSKLELEISKPVVENLASRVWATDSGETENQVDHHTTNTSKNRFSDFKIKN